MSNFKGGFNLSLLLMMSFTFASCNDSEKSPEPSPTDSGETAEPSPIDSGETAEPSLDYSLTLSMVRNDLDLLR